MDEPRLIRLLNAAHETLVKQRMIFAGGLWFAGVSFLWPLFYTDPALVVSGNPAMGVLSLLFGFLLVSLPVPRLISLCLLHERLYPRPALPIESLWALRIAHKSTQLEGLVRPWKTSRTAMPRHVVIQVWACWKSESAPSKPR